MTQPGRPRRDGLAEERARLRADFERRLRLAGPSLGHDDLGALLRTVRQVAALSSASWQSAAASRSGR